MAAITFTASAAAATNVRFRFEANPYPDVEPSYDTEYVLIDSATAMEYTVEIPAQGDKTFNSFLMYVVERDSPVMVTNVVITSGAADDPEPVDASAVADFTTGAFEGATVDAANEIYTFTGQDWAGFANNNLDLYPLSFPEAAPSPLRHRQLHRRMFGSASKLIRIQMIEESYDTEYVLISSATAMEYTVEIPAQGDKTFNSFLMYVVERDSPVMVKDVVLATSGAE